MIGSKMNTALRAPQKRLDADHYALVLLFAVRLAFCSSSCRLKCLSIEKTGNVFFLANMISLQKEQPQQGLLFLRNKICTSPQKRQTLRDTCATMPMR